MDTPKLFILTTHFNSLHKSFLSELLYRVMFRFGNSIWALLSSSFFQLFELIRYLSGYQADDENSRVIDSQQDDQVASNNSVESESSIFSDTETSQLSFGFRYQTGRDLSVVQETESSVYRENGLSISTSKYQFITGKDVGGFIEEPETMSFTVQELFVDSDEGSVNYRNLNSTVTANAEFEEQLYQESNNFINTEALITQDLQKLVLDVDSVDNEETEDSVQAEDAKTMHGLEECFPEDIFVSGGAQSLPFQSNMESSSSSGEFQIDTQKIFSSDCSFNEESGSDISISISETEEEFIEKVLRFEESESIFSSDKLEESDDEYIELKPNSCEEFNELEKSAHTEEEQSIDNQEKQWDLDHTEQEQEGNDVLLEHEELIEQMKSELKNIRTGGLPTILEDCETPKVVGDLKPLKIDEKLEHGDRMAEIQKFYKRYAEKMRKLDILNYQTMHAISFLQLKDPNQSSLSQRSSVSAIKSLLLPSFWPSKLTKIHADPTLKSIIELERDLEVVYVGQICLSWEILHWQHRKLKDLIEYDSQGHRSYNQVADEFQQFQVLLNRFIEDEKFKGPRITNYVKNRSVVRSLLQVPPVKDDCLKDKKGKKKEEEQEEEKYEISISMLADTIEASMRVFCELVRADRDAANVNLDGTINQDTADSELLLDIKTTLQKKEKRLKDIMRSGNCLVKKFKKQGGGRVLDDEMLVCQVELRLVSRVLNMSKLSNDHLVWCQTKLNNINFINRKIHVEHSFLLFPC